jgi:AraC-like DNA-binding protein
MLRQKLSRMRQPGLAHRDAPRPNLAVRGYAVTHPSGTVVLPTADGWDQLLYASTGVMTVEAASGTWVIPPHRALWAPDGVSCRIVMHGRVSVRTLYLRTTLAALPRRLEAVNVPPLLRELVLHAVRAAPLDMDVVEHRRLVGVIVDQLRTLAQVPLQLPLPTDPRGLALTKALTDEIGAERGLDALAASVGASRRTLERIFMAETGLTVGRGRQRSRLVRALQLLAEGRPVTEVATTVGYSTPSAFGAMFRQELGTTPGGYFRR